MGDVQTKGEVPPEDDVQPVESPAPSAGEAKPTAPTAPPARQARGPGQIQLQTGRGIEPKVDGVAMPLTADGYLSTVPAGQRRLVVYNLLGRQKGQQSVTVAAGRRTVLHWDGKEISPAGSGALIGARPLLPPSDVVFSGLLVSDASTQVSVDGQPASRQSDGTFLRLGVPSGDRHARIVAGGIELFNGTIDVGMGGRTHCGFVMGGGRWNSDCTHHP